jgi:hypothetical protein
LGTRNPNYVSLMLILALVSLSSMWVVFSTYVVPSVIKSAYRGQSLPIFNRMITGQASHPVEEYLADSDRFRWPVLLDFSLAGLLVVLVIRPEFRRAVWGSAPLRPPGPALLEERAIPPRKAAHGVAFLLYSALAIIFTLPTSLHPTRALLGDGGDNYQHAWFLWEFARAVAHGHNPFRTDLILYPFGANLAWATMDPLAGILALPLSFSVGAALTYNISLLLQLALGAFFARLLFLRISQHPAAATIGGMIFGFSPFLLSHALAHLSLVTAFPMPLYVLALDKLLDAEKPSWKEGSFLGLALLLTALAHYHYTVLCLMFTAVVLAIDFGAERLGLLKRVWKPLLVSGVTFLICFSPVLLMLLGDYSSVANPRSGEEVQANAADLAGFFVPSLYHSFLGQHVRKMSPTFLQRNRERTIYIGLVALLLGMVGGWSAQGRQRRWAGRAMVAGVLFAALSLGPAVQFLGKPTALPAPGSLLYKVVFTRFVREPARLSVITTLCVALLATLGLAFILNKVQRPWQRSLLLYIVGTSVFFECGTLPFHSSSIVNPEVGPEVYQGVPTVRAVVPESAQRCTLPPRFRDCTVLTAPLYFFANSKKPMWMQLMDGGRYRLVDGYVGNYLPDRVRAEFDEMPIVRFLSRVPLTPIVPAPDREFADFLVRKLNLCAVVVFDASQRQTELNYVREVFRAQESTVGSCAVFEIAAEPKNSLFERRRSPPGYGSRRVQTDRKGTAQVGEASAWRATPAGMKRPSSVQSSAF